MSSPKNDPTPVILFGGAEGVLPIAREFTAKGIPVHILNKPWAEVGFSRGVHRIHLPKDAPYPQSAVDFLLGSESDYLRGSVLLAGLDPALEAIARNRARLAEKFKLDLSDPVAQLRMLDKLATYHIAREAGVTTPKFWEIGTAEDLHRVRDELVYPIIVKPKVSHVFQQVFQAKFIVADDFDAVSKGFQIAEEAGIEVLLVENIPGPDTQLGSYYTYLDENGNHLFDFTKRVIRRYPKNMGVGSYHVTDDVEGVREPALKLFRAAGLRGLANAEFKLDVRDGQWKLIECNARFTAANGLVKKAGFDLGTFVYNRIVGIENPPLRDFESGLRLWDPLRDISAFFELRRLGDITFRQWLASLAHPKMLPIFSWKDPLPSLVRLGTRFSKLRRHLRAQKRAEQLKLRHGDEPPAPTESSALTSQR